MELHSATSFEDVVDIIVKVKRRGTISPVPAGILVAMLQRPASNSSFAQEISSFQQVKIWRVRRKIDPRALILIQSLNIHIVTQVFICYLSHTQSW